MRDRNQVWWTEEEAKAVGKKEEVWKRIYTIKDRGEVAGCGVASSVWAEDESSKESCG